METQKIKYERLQSLFLNVKTGVKHLQDKLDFVRQDFGANTTQVSDTTIVQVLGLLEKILQGMLSKIKDSNDISYLMNTGHDENKFDHHNICFDPIDSLHEDDIQENRPYNRRVTIPTFGEDDDIKAFDPLNDDGMNFEIDDDECDLSRDRIKRFSSQILMSETKKSKNKSKDEV